MNKSLYEEKIKQIKNGEQARSDILDRISEIFYTARELFYEHERAHRVPKQDGLVGTFYNWDDDKNKGIFGYVRSYRVGSNF
jgi:hypothetical protein